MNLLIRSQDRENLIQPTRLFIVFDTNIATWDRNTMVNLGKYSTKERALEVLDEIQKLLKPKGVVKTIDTSAKIDDNLVYRPQQNMEIIPLSNAIVYEMPKE